MKKFISLVFSFFVSLIIFAQSFEGEIIYQNSFTSKLPSLTNEQLSAMIGNRQEYYIKGADYKSIMNGTYLQWQSYLHADNKLFNKFANSESVLWNDASVNPDSVLSSELHKDAVDILGYRCDELILNCKSGKQTYYFSSKFPVDSKLYINHKYGNWYDMLSKTNALPLKIIVENAQFNLESVAVEIKSKKIEATFFQLPAGIKTEKSPY